MKLLMPRVKNITFEHHYGDLPNFSFEVTAFTPMTDKPKTFSEFATAIETRLSSNAPKYKKIIFNPPATVIMWEDGTKTVVMCQPGDTYDKEKGLAMAYLKKLMGNDNTFNKVINKRMEAANGK